VEEWRAVAGFEGCYQVSSKGRVLSVERLVSGPYGLKTVPERIRRPAWHRRPGEWWITLHKDGHRTYRRVGDLVREAFCGKP
jgi:hypothetical protein